MFCNRKPFRWCQKYDAIGSNYRLHSGDTQKQHGLPPGDRKIVLPTCQSSSSRSRDLQVCVCEARWVDMMGPNSVCLNVPSRVVFLAIARTHKISLPWEHSSGEARELFRGNVPLPGHVIGTGLLVPARSKSEQAVKILIMPGADI